MSNFATNIAVFFVGFAVKFVVAVVGLLQSLITSDFYKGNYVCSQ